MRVPRTVVAAVVASLPGCVLLTGSTDGYELVDAGAEGGVCRSAADCSSDAAGHQACCVSVSGVSIVGPTCGPSPCASPGAQLCATDTECTGTSCILQSCMFSAAAPIQACGLVPTCTATAPAVVMAADGGD
jgi:hypothetical protein